ncbi:M1 family metallopeptidase [Undibacterium cyanobacteriorum]|uniref:Aminopeptidase N n=1 Tax=Undibacterium cyanobacteriorum TaxID=3073561 RepID=A0ABY9RM06_9BURK|nr:M1 family metallopeptidase [Undibacterium sp. 20NA77.5]WMW81991.1 M1 family metallopeptidase [Undibacterium sp. 20NA77.5]
MKYCVAFLASLLLLGSAFGDDRYPRNKDIDVVRYRFLIEVNDQNDVIQGQSQVNMRFLARTKQFSLDLASKTTDGKGMEVLAVKQGDQMLKFEHAQDRLTIYPKDEINGGDSLTFQIEYRGQPAAGLFISKNKFGDRVFFADNWPNLGHQWLPTIDHPSDKAAVEFLVIAPAQYSVVANGLKMEESYIDPQRKLTHWKEDVPLAVKVMVIGVAKFAMQESARFNDVAISSWVFPQNRSEGFRDYAIAISPLSFFHQKIGPYPYKKLANVQSKTRFGGLENANTIFYFENSVTGKAEQEALVAHEIAHQWFGNSATEADWHHVWLSEGFATYFTNLYIENTYGHDRFLGRQVADREKIIRYSQKQWRPIVDTEIADPKNVLSPNTYEKGGWVLHMLRQELGDEVFWQGIRAYYAKFAGKNALSEDFASVMEQVSGKDLKAFFKQWLYQAGYPVLKGSWTYDAKTKEVVLELEQSNQDLFQFPLEVAIQQPDGKLQVQTVKIANFKESFRLKTDFVPKLVSLDPHVRLLFDGKLTAN